MAGDRSIYIGYDPREIGGYVVAKGSIERRLTQPVPIYPLVLDRLRAKGWYTREHDRRGGQLWDVISGAPMSTEFAISRFLVPHLARLNVRAGKNGWALFVDGDVMARASLVRLFEIAERSPDKAVMVVKHDHKPFGSMKMDGQIQTQYSRKNWSSVMLFNLDHPANDALNLELVNTVPGRDLHNFCWLGGNEDLIGELTPDWNYLVGHTDHPDPKLVHFTDGIPLMPGYEDSEFAGEFIDNLYKALGR